MTTARFVSVGESLGLVLPASVLARLEATDGGEVLLTETPDGIVLQPLNAAGHNQLDVAMRVMDEDKETLKKLAE